MLVFLLVFVGAPIVELYFIVEVARQVGVFPTIGLTLFTAALGGYLVRLQGFSTLQRVREVSDRGEVPALEMLEGLVLLISGVLLLLPGFITDILGFLSLIPALRRGVIIGALARSGILRRYPGPPPGQTRHTEQPRVIEGDYKREDEP